MVPAAVLRSLGRGLLAAPELWRLLADLPGFLAAGRHERSAATRTGYPGHLHVNLLPESRGRAVGRAPGGGLPRRGAAAGAAAGGAGRGLREQSGGRRFFERLGFQPLRREPAFKPPPAGGGREWKIVYGRRVRVR